MIQEHIEEIESRLRESPNLPEATRAELLSTLAALKAEISTREAAGGQPPITALNELTESVAGFETSHPDLVAAVNRLAVILSNMGM